MADAAVSELLQSIVDLARATFGARASSILSLDEDANELVFIAVAGEGSDSLVGRRISSSTGIAGWVLVTREPLVVDDLAGDPRFGREAAESTGYVPRAIVAVPLLRGDRVLGVLEVLDPAETNLLDLFAKQAAIGLALASSA